LACDLANLTLPEFLDGVRSGLVAAVVGGLAALAVRQWRRVPPRYLPIGGLLLGLGYLETLRETNRLLPSFALALAILALGGAVAGRRQWGWIGRGVAAIPGTYLLVTHAGLVNGTDGLWATAVATIAGAALIPDIDERGARLGIGPVLYAVSCVGMYETVPDPKLALALVAVALPLLALGWPLPFARLGGAWASVAAGSLAWAAAVGGTGRLSAVYGGCACLGMLVAEPAARLLSGSAAPVLSRIRARPRNTAILAAAQVLAVYVPSRVAGLNHDAVAAGAIASAEMILLIAGIVVANRVTASWSSPPGGLAD
jgi:hypothetical protein